MDDLIKKLQELAAEIPEEEWDQLCRKRKAKYVIGDRVKDEDGNVGVIVIAYNDGDLCYLENDAAHPNPVLIESGPLTQTGN